MFFHVLSVSAISGKLGNISATNTGRLLKKKDIFQAWLRGMPEEATQDFLPEADYSN
jgi:hypothetical protein